MKRMLQLSVAALAAFAIFGCGTQSHPSSGEDQKIDIPAVPTGLSLVEANSDSLSFIWDEVAGAESYTYRLLKGMTLVKRESVEKNGALVSGLDPETKYRFSVCADNSKGSSKYTDYIEAETSAENTPGGGGGGGVTPGGDSEVYDMMKIPACEEDGVARAFPGAEGGGMYVTGGRGGSVYHVTTLSDSGAGSLRYGVENASRPCTIVFDLAGTITLSTPLVIRKGDLTIAGQTAPGDGICLKGRYTQVNADNVIIRFIRFRLGDENPNANDNDDCIYGRYLSGVIIDHCSMSWSIDETVSFYANSNVSIQWCFICESMRSCQLHSKGNHGYGGIWGGDNVSYHHNLLAHHDSRNPRFDHPHIYEDHTSPARRGVIDYRNNVVYDWGSNSSYGGEGYGSGKGTGINMVSNLYKPGPSSKDRKYFLDSYAVYSSCKTCGNNIDEGYALVYMNGNVHTDYSDITSNNSKGIYWHNGEGHTNYGLTSSSQFPLNGPSGEKVYTTTHAASDVLEAVCEFGGACLSRDKVDERNSSDALDGGGQILDCVNTSDGKVSAQSVYGYTWPELSATSDEISRAATDTDGDGIPDYYESLLRLNAKDKTDGAAKTIDKNGRYTNLEMYLHYLVRDIVAGQNKTGEYSEIK